MLVERYLLWVLNEIWKLLVKNSEMQKVLNAVQKNQGLFIFSSVKDQWRQRRSSEGLA
jgi:hypothetical protein